MITTGDGARFAFGAWIALVGIAVVLGLCWTFYLFMFEGLAL